MTVTWNTLTTQGGASWVPQSGEEGGWLDPRRAHLLTETGLFILTEDGRPLAIEGPDATGSVTWVAV